MRSSGLVAETVEREVYGKLDETIQECHHCFMSRQSIQRARKSPTSPPQYAAKRGREKERVKHGYSE